MRSAVNCASTSSKRTPRLTLASESSQATSIAVVSLDEHGVRNVFFHFNDTANFGWQVDDTAWTSTATYWLHIASLSWL